MEGIQFEEPYMDVQGLTQDYQLLVLQEGESGMFQYFSTILYVYFRKF